MAGVAVNPDGVTQAGTRVAAAGSDALVPAVGPIVPAALDPVSVGVAETLSARSAAIFAHGVAAGAIKDYYAGLLWASADAYTSQDSANSAGLAPGDGAPAQAMTPLPPSVPAAPLPPASVPAPVFGGAPGGGEVIAALIHAGNADPLYAAAHQLRQYATELDDTGAGLRGIATQLPGHWWSRAGEEADTAVRRLGHWHHDHADHARAAAAAADAQAENFALTKAATPTPKQFADNDMRLAAATAAAARDPIYAPVVTQLQAQRAELEGQATSRYASYQAAASGSNLSGAPLDPPPHNDIQMLGGPYGPAPREPAPLPPNDPAEPTGADGGAGASGPHGGPQPKQPHPAYPNRSTDGTYGPGNSVDGKWDEKVALDKAEVRTGIPIIREQVRASHPNAFNKDGTPQSRYYDGLQPTGVPGEYIGIEAKGDGVSLTGPQARFDDQVTPENPATAVLNGEQIKIVDTRVAYPELGSRDPLPPGPPVGGASGVPPAQSSAGAPPPPVQAAPKPDWGTYVPPEEAAKGGGELGNLGKVIEQFDPPGPTDPRGKA